MFGSRKKIKANGMLRITGKGIKKKQNERTKLDYSKK